MQIVAVPASLVAAPFRMMQVAQRSDEREITFTAEARLSGSSEKAFALIDPESPENWLPSRGISLTQLSGPDRKFRMTGEAVFEKPMIMEMIEATRPNRIGLRSTSEDGSPLGAVESTTGYYEFEDAYPNCRVKLVEKTRFKKSLGAMGQAFHELLMSWAVKIEVARLAAATRAM